MASRMFATVVLLLQLGTAVASPVSGDYDGLLLAVDPDRKLITGYFESETGNGQFSCIFYVRGDLGGPASKIKAWFPSEKDPKSVIEGVIEESLVQGKPAVTVKLHEEHGGCWNVQRFATDSFPLRLSAAGDWKEIRVVSSSRAHFYGEPREDKKRQAYVVTGNALRLYELLAGWARAEYIGQNGKRTSGWVRESDLFRPYPPTIR